MRKALLTLLLLSVIIMACAQPHVRRIYLDEALNITSKKESTYTAFVTREAGRWVARANYHDSTPLLTISFKNSDLTVKDGHFTLYYPGGKPKQDGDFTLDRADGVWQSWFSNGQLQDSGRVVANRFSGLWKHWYENGQLKNIHEYSTRWQELPADPPFVLERKDPRDPRDDFERNEGLAYIPVPEPFVPRLRISGKSDGRWQSWYEYGPLESTGAYVDNMMEGVWKWFRENGQPSSIETYSKGKITQLECYDENGLFTGNSCGILKPPVFTHPVFSCRQYILDKLKRVYGKPADVGRVTIMFTVTKTGKITNLLVIGAPTPEVSNYVKQLFRTMPAWSPALSHNRAIDFPLEVSLF